jgi:hypothetical protein
MGSRSPLKGERPSWEAAGLRKFLVVLSIITLSVVRPAVAQQQPTPDAQESESNTTSEVAAAQEDAAAPDSDASTPKVKWRTWVDACRGLTTWRLFDGRLTLQLGGRLQIDGTLANGNDELEDSVRSLDNSVDLRRLRVFADGTIDHHLRYLVSYDFGANIVLLRFQYRLR